MFGTLLISGMPVMALEPMVAEALVCNPGPISRQQNPQACFVFYKCKEKGVEHLTQLDAALTKQYVEMAGSFFGAPSSPRRDEYGNCIYNQDQFARDQRAAEIAKAQNDRLERELKETQAEQKKKDMQAQKDAAEKAENDKLVAELRARRNGLLDGSIKISNFQDAVLFYSNENLLLATRLIGGLAASPLLTADGAAYQGELTIEFQESNGVLRCKDNWSGRYVFLQSTKKSVRFSSAEMRINGRIKVVGKYVGNISYVTVGGEQRTAPLLEVLYQDDITY